MCRWLQLSFNKSLLISKQKRRERKIVCVFFVCLAAMLQLLVIIEPKLINLREDIYKTVIDFELTEEHLALQKTVREFCQGEVASYIVSDRGK